MSVDTKNLLTFFNTMFNFKKGDIVTLTSYGRNKAFLYADAITNDLFEEFIITISYWDPYALEEIYMLNKLTNVQFTGHCFKRSLTNV